MRITMLGTAAADGWPTPFCTCASCTTLRARGEVRGQTSALLDHRILIDAGPEAPRAAVRAGTTLANVDLLLFTHAHPDHCHPQLLLWRRWTGLTHPLVVAGPADALDACRDWVAADDPVRWHPLVAGDTMLHDGWRITALAATHTPGAILYDITDAEGSSLLYATDTGPLSDDTLSRVSGRAYDAVLLEETWGDRDDHGTDHHSLGSFGATVADLRRRGAVVDGTRVRAIHLGHRNPPQPELGRRLAAFGADAPIDGETFGIGRRARPEDATRVDDHATLHPHATSPTPPRRTLVIGGARSGKSSEAERLLAAEASVTYVATAPPRPDDAEWTDRVRAHQERRPAAWRTLETLDIAAVLNDARPGDAVLVDCLALWTTSMLDHADAWSEDVDRQAVEARIEAATRSLIRSLERTHARVVLVTNEVGSGVVPASASGRLFRDTLGRVNLHIAAACEDVLHVVAGRARSV